jgi:glycosyltransferase involved in cell wall biosynthesis
MKEKNFIIFSTADWDNPFWTNKQHIASRLAKRGHKVLYIESLGLRTPTIKVQDLSRIIKRIASFFKGARKVDENLWVYSPLVIPLHRFRLIRFINHILLITILKFYKWKFSLTSPVVWTYNPIVLKLMKALNPSKMIYHSVDDLSAAPGLNTDVILNEEKKLLAEMDAVFCTSLKIYDHCKTIAVDKAHYHSNVVDYDHFSKARLDQPMPEDLKNIPRPLIGFIGALSEYKVDLDLIIKTASEKPDWQWVMIGKAGEGQPGSSIENIRNVPNIHLLGVKDYKILPQYLHHFDICTIPTPINEYTNSMFPMKFYEFMAAGKPIIARDIDSLKEVRDAHYTYSTQEEFVQLTSKALEEGVINKKLCDKLSQENTWEKRLDKMIGIIC